MKRTLFRQSNGRFRRGTLRDLGVLDSALSDGKEHVCQNCGHVCRPIMKQWICEKCKHQQNGGFK